MPAQDRTTFSVLTDDDKGKFGGELQCMIQNVEKSFCEMLLTSIFYIVVLGPAVQNYLQVDQCMLLLIKHMILLASGFSLEML